MKLLYVFTVASLSLLVLTVPIQGAEKESGIVSSPPKSQIVNDLYPGLMTGVLTYAAASELPQGVLLKAGPLLIDDKDLAETIAGAPEQMRPKLEKNELFILEQVATTKLFLAEARIEAAQSGEDLSEKDEQATIQDYVRALVKNVKVSDEEIISFYNENKDSFGGASMMQIRPQIEQILLQQKQQEFINEHIRTIGKRMRVEISATWLKVQAVLAQDNPVDKVRASGRPSLVDFGSTGCVPCEMLAPILDKLKEKYKRKIDVLVIHVGEEPVLASRYSIQSIPVQIFFDKTGKEVFRHVGFFPQEQIEMKFTELGFK